ncbi:MAG: LysM domain-containing protein [bacterium]|nr:LysM domain-containing protein [bacterium]
MTPIKLRPILILVCAAAFVSACNLARPIPTPTPQPTPAFVPPTPLPGQPSLTPLGQGGGRTVTGENGQVCVIPPGWVEYTVETGDSMGLLAQQTGSTIQQLTTTNCLNNPDNLFVGQTLYLPRPPVISG